MIEDLRCVICGWELEPEVDGIDVSPPQFDEYGRPRPIISIHTCNECALEMRLMRERDAW